MLAKVKNSVRQLERSFEDALLEKHRIMIGEELAKASEFAEEQLEKTLDFSIPRGERAIYDDAGLSDAKVEIIDYVVKTERGRGVYGTFTISVVSTGKTRHEVWHKLNKGTSGRENYKKTGRRRRIRKTSRTVVNRIQAEEFSGYTDEWFTESTERAKPSIRSRNWYKLVANWMRKNKYVGEVRVNYQD